METKPEKSLDREAVLAARKAKNALKSAKKKKMSTAETPECDVGIDRVPYPCSRADAIVAKCPRVYPDADPLHAKTVDKCFEEMKQGIASLVHPDEPHDDEKDPDGLVASKDANEVLKRPKLDEDGNFAPNYGICCVMKFVPSMVEGFAKQLHEALAAHPAIASTLTLIPPEEYRVTLAALEFTGHPKHGKLFTENTDEFVSQLATCQRNVDSELQLLQGSSQHYLKFVAVQPFPTEEVSLSKDYKSAMGLRLEPCPGFEVKLRNLAGDLQLSCGRERVLQRPFAWGVGYFKHTAAEADRLVARQAFYEIVRKLLQDSFDVASLNTYREHKKLSLEGEDVTLSRPSLRFEIALQHPEICSHFTTEKLNPVFPRLSPQATEFVSKFKKSASTLTPQVDSEKLPLPPSAVASSSVVTGSFFVWSYLLPLLCLVVPALVVFAIFE